MSSKTTNKTTKPLPTEKNNCLIHPEQFSAKNLIFSDPVEGTIPGSTIKFRRVLLSYALPDGSVSDVLIPTERLFSYGPQENHDQSTKKLNGYSLSLVLFGKEGASPAEKKFLDVINTVVEESKNHVMKPATKSALKLDPQMDRSELRKLLSCLYYKKGEDGFPLPDASPTLYAKLITTDGKKRKKSTMTEEKKEEKKEESSLKIMTQFFSKKTGQPIDPVTLIGKWGYVKAVIKLEAIFFGAQIRLQCKCVEVEYDPIESSFKPLLPRANAGMLLNTSGFSRDVAKAEAEETKEAETSEKEAPGSLHNSDDEQETADLPSKDSPKEEPVKKETVAPKAPPRKVTIARRPTTKKE